MAQWHEHLPRPQHLRRCILTHDRVATAKALFVPQPLENPMRRVTLFLVNAAVAFKNGVNPRHKRSKLPGRRPAGRGGAPRPAAAPRRDRPGSNKVHVATSVPIVLPPAQEPLATIEPAVASAPVKAELLLQSNMAMRLVANLGGMISTSETRVVESMASMGDGLTSPAKKL